MHRHMVQALKQSFPNSFPTIRGFSHAADDQRFRKPASLEDDYLE